MTDPSQAASVLLKLYELRTEPALRQSAYVGHDKLERRAGIHVFCQAVRRQTVARRRQIERVERLAAECGARGLRCWHGHARQHTPIRCVARQPVAAPLCIPQAAVCVDDGAIG